MKYALIAGHRDSYPLRAMCAVLAGECQRLPGLAAGRGTEEGL